MEHSIFMMFNQDTLVALLSGYAYEPLLVYSIIIGVLTASSFGLPIPEEVTLISAGIIGYFANNPELYPPPNESIEPLNVWVLALVCLLAVFLSDLLVYWFGRAGGKRLESWPKLQRVTQSSAYQRAVQLTFRYGALMPGLFRFTPVIRFPGHLACGILGVSHLRFWLADGTAALLSVPTQVLLVAFYGDEIIVYFKQFKLFIVIMFVLAAIAFLYSKMKRKSAQ